MEPLRLFLSRVCVIVFIVTSLCLLGIILLPPLPTAEKIPKVILIVVGHMLFWGLIWLVFRLSCGRRIIVADAQRDSHSTLAVRKMTEQLPNFPSTARLALGMLMPFTLVTAAALWEYAKGDRLVGLGLFVFALFLITFMATSFRRVDPRLRETMAHLTQDERKQLGEISRTAIEGFKYFLPLLFLFGVPLVFVQIFYGGDNSIQGQLIKLSTMIFTFASFFLICLPTAKLHSKRLKEFLFQSDFARHKNYSPRF